MNSQDHLVCCRSVVEGFILVAQPQELLLAVTFADIDAELNERVIYGAVHRIRLIHVAGTFDGDCSLVIGIAGRAPAAVLLLHTQRNPAVRANAIVAAGLTGRAGKTSANALRRKLTYHAMRRDAVNAVCSLPGMVRGEFGINNEWTIGVSHIDSS